MDAAARAACSTHIPKGNVERDGFVDEKAAAGAGGPAELMKRAFLNHVSRRVTVSGTHR